MAKQVKRNNTSVKDGKLLPGNVIPEAFLNFVQYHSPKRLSKNLRNMLLEYLSQDASIESPDLKDLLFDLQGLFLFLDAAEEHDTKSIG